MRRILLTGGSGQVGTELLHCNWPQDITIVAPSSAELNLADYDSIAPYFAKGNFSAIINAGAYTAVDQAEAHVLEAWRINAMAPAALGYASKMAGIPIVHISTDYVFDGSKETPYYEGDAVGPLNVYGASKEAGEQAVRCSNPQHIVLRTAWVFSPFGKNFIKTIIRLSTERDKLMIVDDQWGSPTSAADLANATKILTLRMMDDRTKAPGVYHFANTGAATWCDLARELFRPLRMAGLAAPSIVPVRTVDYPTQAKRPVNSRLCTDKITQVFGVQPRAWTAALADVRDALASEFKEAK